MAQETPYELRLAGPEDAQDLFQFLVKYFYPEEPVNAAVGRIPADIKEISHLLDLAEGSSVIAVSKADGSIMGCAINTEVFPDIADRVEARAKSFENVTPTPPIVPACRFIAYVLRKNDTLSRIRDKKIVYIHILSVHPEARQSGLARALVNRSIEVGRQKGYALIGSICTSMYSARLLEKLGFPLTTSVAYDEVLGDDGVPLVTPKHPHTHAKMFLMEL